MKPTPQAIQDDLVRQWEAYGPAATQWAISLASAIVDLDRVSTFYSAHAGSIEEQARYGQDSTLPEDLRRDVAIWNAFHNRIPDLKMLLRMNELALRRINQACRELNAIRKSMPKPVEVVADTSLPANAEPAPKPSPAPTTPTSSQPFNHRSNQPNASLCIDPSNLWGPS